MKEVATGKNEAMYIDNEKLPPDQNYIHWILLLNLKIFNDLI